MNGKLRRECLAAIYGRHRRAGRQPKAIGYWLMIVLNLRNPRNLRIGGQRRVHAFQTLRIL